jgi:hypothetical protein
METAQTARDMTDSEAWSGLNAEEKKMADGHTLITVNGKLNM